MRDVLVVLRDSGTIEGLNWPRTSQRNLSLLQPLIYMTFMFKSKIPTYVVRISSSAEYLIKNFDDVGPEDRHSTELLDGAEAEDDSERLSHLRSSKEGPQSEKHTVRSLLVLFQSL